MDKIFEGLLLITIINIVFHFYHVYRNTIAMLILFISSYTAPHTNIDSSQHLGLHFVIREHIMD